MKAKNAKQGRGRSWRVYKVILVEGNMLQQERKEVRDSSIHPEARWLSDLHNESREPWPALGFDLGRWRGRTNRHKSVMPRLWFERHGARGLHLFSLAYDFRFRLRWCSLWS